MTRRGRGFTVVEVLVTIGVIAVLVAILVPAVAKSWGKSRELASAVNLRSIGQVFEMYLGRSDELYPAPEPGRMYQTPHAMMQTSLAHWQASDEWNLLFAEEYPWAEHTALYLSPGAERDTKPGPVMSTILPSFVYSSSFLGQPEIWSGRAIGDDEWERLERSVRQSMVRFPASKALMWDREMPYIREPLTRDEFFNLTVASPTLFADGHVSTRVQAEASEPVRNGAIYAAKPFEKLHNTRDGVQGRDY